MIYKIDRNEENVRPLKVASNIRQSLASIFQEGKWHDNMLDGVFVSISDVKVSRDLRCVVVNVMVANADQELKSCVLQLLKEKNNLLRKMLVSKISLKYAPELRFRWDDGFEKANRVAHLLDLVVSNTGCDTSV
jgi:ribosome-binding factor A